MLSLPALTIHPATIPSLLALSVCGVFAQGSGPVITVFNDRAAFEAAMGSFKVVDDFSLGAPFLGGTTVEGQINAAAKWADVARGETVPSTTWATPFGSTAFGGTWDNTVSGVGGGLVFDLDFGSGTIVTVPTTIPGNAPANVFFGFTSDQPFFAVRTRQFDSAGGTLQETHTLDDLTVQVPAAFADVRFAQSGTGAWDTAAHWDPAAVPNVNQRTFITPAGGSTVTGPTSAAGVRQLVIGNGTASSRLNLNAGAPLTVARGTVVRASATLGGAGRIDSILTMAANSTLTVADGETLQAGKAVPGGFSTAGTITIGTGTLILEDTETTPLGLLTTIAGGTLTALGGTAEIAAGDTLRGHGTLTGAFTLAGSLRAQNGNLNVAQLTSATGSVTVDASRTLNIASPDTLIFSSVNVGAGGTLSTGGLLQPFTTTLAAGATLRGTQGISFLAAPTHTGATTFDAGSGALTINDFSFTPDAADVLNGGRIVLSGSTARLFTGGSGVAGTAADHVVLAGGGIIATSNLTLPASRSIEITTATGQISAFAGTQVSIAGNITGTGRLVLAGGSGGLLGGTIRLTGSNTQAGGTDIAGAMLEVAGDSALGASDGALLIGRENGVTDIPGGLRALANLEIPATRTTTFRRAIVDTNGFEVTFNQPVSGQDLRKQGEGVLRFNTANAFTSGVNDLSIEGGVARSGINEAFGRPRIFLADTVFDLNGFTQTVPVLSGPGEVRLGSGGVLTFIGGSSIEAVISGSGALHFGQEPFIASSHRLLAENTFTGQVNVILGNRVSIKSTAAFGAAGNAVHLDNGGLESDFEAPGPVVIPAAFPLTIGAGGAFFGANGKSLVIELPLTGSGPIGVSGGGEGYEVRFANPANTFTGNIQLGDRSSSEVLGIVANGSLGNAANIITLGDRHFDGESTSVSAGIIRAFANLTIPASRAIRLNGDAGSFRENGGVFDTNGFNVAVETAVSELRPGMELMKTGEGTLTLQSACTYTGATIVRAGTLAGTGTVAAVEVESDATLAPGASPGTLHTGNVTLRSGSILALEFASASSADQLAVTGTVTLTGDVELKLLPAYTPDGPDTFTVIANDGDDPVNTSDGSALFTIAGNQLAEGETFTAAGSVWSISYTGGTGNDVTLTLISTAPPVEFSVLTFTIAPPPGGEPGQQIEGTLSGSPNTALRLERSTDLITWGPLSSINLNETGTAAFQITDPDTSPRAFYRIVPP